MNKKNIAIIKLTVISVIVSLLLIFSFISFDGFAGFYNAAEKGLELNEGIYATYDVIKADGVTDEEYAEDVNTTFLKLKSLIEQRNYQGAVIYKTSDNSIRIESPDVDDAKTLLSEIGSGQFKIRISSDSDEDVKISGTDVDFAVATTSSSTGYWGTYIQFTEEAGDILSEITSSATSSSSVYLYFYRGDSEEYFFYLPVSSQITNDYLFISSSSGSMTQEDATELAISVSCGSMPAVVEIEGEVSSIASLDGALLGLTIALGVSALLILLIFAVIYREIGFMACLSVLFYIGATLFLIQAIPVITVSAASLGAILVGLILIAGCNFIILEKVKSEYAMGKKLNMAIKTGYKRAINVVADICGAVTLNSLIIFLIGTDIIKSFGLILLVGAVVSCFSALFLTYQLMDAYSAFNKNDGKKVNFTREGNADEIE